MSVEKNTDPVSLLPYRGTRDYLPPDWRVIQWIFSKWRETCEAFGYEEYSTPLLEEFKLYASKTSEEILNQQLYRIEDKGGRQLALRPELTPSLARVIAANGKSLKLPIRFFSIGTCLRYERPQRGRTRQFDQFNLDVLGDTIEMNDLEVLSSIIYMMKKFGVPDNLYQIKINHRKLVDFVLTEIIAIDRSHSRTVLNIIDALNKTGLEQATQQLKELGLDDKQIDSTIKFLNNDETFMKENVQSKCAEYDYLMALVDKVQSNWGLSSEVVKFSPDIMRGFDYYTGMIFEVYDVSPENRRALFGGGRYDNLVGSLSNFQISGVGYGVSEISIYNFLETHKLIPDLKKEIDVYVFALNTEYLTELFRIATKLRLIGYKVELSPYAYKVNKGLANASELGARVAIFTGEDEYSKQSVVWKDLLKKDQKTLTYEDVFDMKEVAAD